MLSMKGINKGREKRIILQSNKMNKIVGGRVNQVNIAEQHYEQYCRGEGVK